MYVLVSGSSCADTCRLTAHVHGMGHEQGLCWSSPCLAVSPSPFGKRKRSLSCPSCGYSISFPFSGYVAAAHASLCCCPLMFTMLGVLSQIKDYLSLYALMFLNLLLIFLFAFSEEDPRLFIKGM